MRLLLSVVVGIAFLAVSTAPACFAQDNPGQIPEWASPATSSVPDRQPEEAHQPTPPGTPGVPVNGPLALLALAGGAYALRRLRPTAEA